MRATTKIINKSAITSNLRTLSALAQQSKTIAVLKANAYGHEATALCDALDDADLFAVATIKEALAIRESGSDKTILLLEGAFEPADVALAFEQNFQLVISTPQQLTWLLAYQHSFSHVWYKLDTGMGRLGFQIGRNDKSTADADTAIHQLLTQYSEQQIILMTHFADADTPNRDFTNQQILLFDDFAHNYPDCQQSLCNSAGTLSYPHAHRDYIRLGISLYGISPFEQHCGADHDLIPVMTLKTRVLSIKQHAAGDKIGYGCTYTTTDDSYIAICEVGYADGYLRFIPSGSPIIINDSEYTIAGRISMDMVAVAVDEHVHVGDEVICWGSSHLPVERIAECAQTIPHQLLTAVTERPKKLIK